MVVEHSTSTVITPLKSIMKSGNQLQPHSEPIAAIETEPTEKFILLNCTRTNTGSSKRAVMCVYAMDFDYYVLELEGVDGPIRIEVEFDAESFRFLIAEGYDRYIYEAVDLTPENVFLLVYLFAKYIERALSEEEIRALLR